jgi:hypothetical protein
MGYCIAFRVHIKLRHKYLEALMQDEFYYE